MKIEISKMVTHNWHYKINPCIYTQEEYDYIFKFLYFDKLQEDCFVVFNDENIEMWFKKTYTDKSWLDIIYNNSPLGYQWLKNNWGKGVFKLYVYYSDKQELKTIVNKRINIKLIRK